MKRNMDLIRLLLLNEEGESGDINLTSYTFDEINYHTALLKEAELVEAKIDYSSEGGKKKIPSRVYIEKITWKGHEFLDQSKNNNNWEKAKEYVLSRGQELSIASMEIALGGVIKGALS